MGAGVGRGAAGGAAGQPHCRGQPLSLAPSPAALAFGVGGVRHRRAPPAGAAPASTRGGRTEPPSTPGKRCQWWQMAIVRRGWGSARSRRSRRGWRWGQAWRRRPLARRARRLRPIGLPRSASMIRRHSGSILAAAKEAQTPTRRKAATSLSPEIVRRWMASLHLSRDSSLSVFQRSELVSGLLLFSRAVKNLSW
jgi:hypothetical protein